MPSKEPLNIREERFIYVAKCIKETIIRNRDVSEEDLACPILVEGINDVKSLREIGFIGKIETINRGWDRSRMIAYLYEKYGSELSIDGYPKIILLMDWDRTGDRLQKSFKALLESTPSIESTFFDKSSRSFLFFALAITIESKSPVTSYTP